MPTAKYFLSVILLIAGTEILLGLFSPAILYFNGGDLPQQTVTLWQLGAGQLTLGQSTFNFSNTPIIILFGVGLIWLSAFPGLLVDGKRKVFYIISSIAGLIGSLLAMSALTTDFLSAWNLGVPNVTATYTFDSASGKYNFSEGLFATSIEGALVLMSFIALFAGIGWVLIGKNAEMQRKKLIDANFSLEGNKEESMEFKLRKSHVAVIISLLVLMVLFTYSTLVYRFNNNELMLIGIDISWLAIFGGFGIALLRAMRKNKSYSKIPSGLWVLSAIWLIFIFQTLYDLPYLFLGMANQSTIVIDQTTSLAAYLDWLTWASPLTMLLLASITIIGVAGLFTVYGFINGKNWSYKYGIRLPLILIVVYAALFATALLSPDYPNYIVPQSTTLPVFSFDASSAITSIIITGILAVITILYIRRSYVKESLMQYF